MSPFGPSLGDSVPKNQGAETSTPFPVPSIPQRNYQDLFLQHNYYACLEHPEYSVPYHQIPINIGPPIEGHLKIEGRWHTVPSWTGSVSLFPANLPYELHCHGEINFIKINLHPDLIIHNSIGIFNTDQVELIGQMVFQDPLIQQIGLALKTEWDNDYPGSQLYIESMANALAVHLLRNYSNQGHRNPMVINSLSASQLQRVIDYIDTYLDQSLTLEKLAAIAHLNPCYFSRAFKKLKGITPHQYVIYCRVERAKKLLLQGTMNLADIAIACGFSHQSHLNRHFKRLTGVTPKIFLKT
jgi:AraC family transcriptional regulator